MDRAEKQNTVEQLVERLAKAQFVSLHTHSGLSVEEITLLRRDLRSVHTELRVVKNTLARMAIRGTALAKLEPYFRGPTAVALCQGDAGSSAKALIRFAKDNPKLQFKAALLGSSLVTEQDFTNLSRLPSRDMLIATLLGVMKGPPSGLVNTLSGILRKLLGTLQAIEQAKSKPITE